MLSSDWSDSVRLLCLLVCCVRLIGQLATSSSTEGIRASSVDLSELKVYFQRDLKLWHGSKSTGYHVPRRHRKKVICRWFLPCVQLGSCMHAGMHACVHTCACVRACMSAFVRMCAYACECATRDGEEVGNGKVGKKGKKGKGETGKRFCNTQDCVCVFARSCASRITRTSLSYGRSAL